ncbi:MAG TPA: AAA family ATPase [Terriglobales bacterium]|nr:AAA family ATPase [Terriglobales bacterium]
MASVARVLLNPRRRGPQAERLLAALRERVVGQEDALLPIVDAYQTFLAGLQARQRPIANFLFLGPTGTGKTHVVESLAAALFDNPKAVIKVDCAEFQHSHEIAKLIGSPPGYLGHRETHPVLTQEALNQFQTADLPLSLVLFDEIEKASDALWQLLLGILDKAVLTLGDNRKVSFAQTMIFMTSNLGAAEMQSVFEPHLGFAPAAAVASGPRLAAAATEAARRKFSPEFFNRLDSVIVFHPLDPEQLGQVLDLELNWVRERLRTGGAPAGFAFRCSPAARAMLLRVGTDPKYGARPLKRAIERLLVHPLASLIATRQVQAQDSIWVDVDAAGGEALTFEREQAQAARAKR